MQVVNFTHMDLKPIIDAAKGGATGMPIPSVTFSNVVKHPLTYALILLSCAAGFFVHEFVLSTKKQDTNCKQEIKSWQDAYNNERTINLQMTTVLLEQKQNSKTSKDSTQAGNVEVRQKLVKKSLKVIKKS